MRHVGVEVAPPFDARRAVEHRRSAGDERWVEAIPAGKGGRDKALQCMRTRRVSTSGRVDAPTIEHVPWPSLAAGPSRCGNVHHQNHHSDEATHGLEFRHLRVHRRCCTPRVALRGRRCDAASGPRQHESDGNAAARALLDVQPWTELGGRARETVKRAPCIRNVPACGVNEIAS